MLYNAGVLNLFHLRIPCIPLELFTYPHAIIFLIQVPPISQFAYLGHFHIPPETFCGPSGAQELKVFILGFKEDLIYFFQINQARILGGPRT